GSVKHHQSSAIAHVLLEACAYFLRPVGTVVIHHDRLIMVEVRFEIAEVSVRLWSSQNRHRKQSGLFKLLLQHRGRQPPVVVSACALPVKNHDLDEAVSVVHSVTCPVTCPVTCRDTSTVGCVLPVGRRSNQRAEQS